MKDPLLRTKLQRPPIAPDIVPRDRLLELLNSGRQRPLTLISAPAGYGKSTLASRWVAGCTCPSGWVSLDENDNDLRSFLGYVLAAVRSGFPRMVLQSEAFIEAGQIPSPQALARYLLNDLHQVREPFILVLDDFHRIHDDAIQDLIAELLVHPSTRMHLALLARRDPALPLASLRGRGQLTEIRAADLRFTPEETAAFVGKMLNVEVDSTTAALLERKTEGWVTGLRLAGLYLRDQENLAQRVAELSGSSRNIAEYLVTEVLSRQPPEMAVLLMESAILDRFCAPLLAALRGARADQGTLDTKAFIRWLVDANIFLVPLDDEGYWYRYHHLFQEFLLSLLHERRDPDTITQLHKKTSRWFAENQLPDEAIRHALLAGDTQTAVRLVIAHRYELMNNSQFSHLKRWLEALRMDLVAETPLLVSTPAFIGIEHGQDVDVYTYTEAAKRILDSLSPGSAEYAALNGEVKVIQGFIDMVWGNADSALAHTEEALESLSSRAYLIRSLGVLTLAACHQMKGEIEHAVQEIRKTISNPGWPANIRARIHFYLAIISYMEADLDGAIAASRECLRLVRGYPFTHTTTFAWYLIGAAHYWRNETAEAESHLLKVLADYHLSNPSYTGNAGFVMACICLARNCAQKADQVLKQVSNHFREYNYATMLDITQAFRVEFALRQGNIGKARQMSKHLDFDMRPPIWFFYVPQLTPIKLLLAEGTGESLEKASRRLSELDRQLDRINRKSVRIDVLAMLSLVFWKQGERTAALQKLQAALDLGAPGGWIRNFVDLGAPMTDMLERLNRIQPGNPFAEKVLAACKAEADDQRSANRVAAVPSDVTDDLSGILTHRELELLPLLAEGLSNKEIASKLFISAVTVKAHLRNIYRKLDARGRIEALRKASALGIIRTG